MSWSRLFQRSPSLPYNGSLESWYQHLLNELGGEPASFDLALGGGHLAATPGLAFLAGYQAAMRVLWPSAPWSLGALCVTEKGVSSPKQMETVIEGLNISGHKDFVTAAGSADWLIVAARDLLASDTRIVLGVVYSGAAGLTIETLPDLAFIPEIGHARLQLDTVQCRRLAGDGWSDYVKPFRTLEDGYVLIAINAWLYGVAVRNDWPLAVRSGLLTQLAALRDVMRLSPNEAETHVLLGAILIRQAELSDQVDQAFVQGDEQLAALWQRDRVLLTLAGKAREIRLQRAKEALGLSVSDM